MVSVPDFVIACVHDFQAAPDLPVDIYRCVKCEAAGYESLQTQFPAVPG